MKRLAYTITFTRKGATEAETFETRSLKAAYATYDNAIKSGATNITFLDNMGRNIADR